MSDTKDEPDALSGFIGFICAGAATCFCLKFFGVVQCSWLVAFWPVLSALAILAFLLVAATFAMAFHWLFKP